MKMILRTLSLLAWPLALLWACKDVVEPDLSKQSIALITPQDHDTTTDATITFWWQKIDEQNTYRYRIQIAKPDFIAPQALILDSVTTSDKYTFSLSPGTYAWRVRAENGSSYTPYATRSLVVDSNKNLASQMVITLPVGVTTSTITTKTASFSWLSLYAADYYTITLTGGASPLDNVTQTITATSYTHTFNDYGSYTWQVKAYNTLTPQGSKPSTLNTVNIMLTAPSNLSASADSSATLGGPVVLSWNNYSPATGDSLYIYKGSANGTLVYNNLVTTKTYTANSLSLQVNNTYWWKVKSTDGTHTSVPVSYYKGFKIK